MRKLSLIIILFLSFCTILFAQNIEKKIMAFCKSKWGNDYSMIKYEYDNQIEAYLKYQKLHEKMKDEPILIAVYKRAEKKWYQSKYGTSDWPMVIYEIENQTNALFKMSDYYELIENDKTVEKIVNEAFNKWKDGDTYDYTMVLYEVEKQIEAYNSLRK